MDCIKRPTTPISITHENDFYFNISKLHSMRLYHHSVLGLRPINIEMGQPVVTMVSSGKVSAPKASRNLKHKVIT